MKLAVYHPWLKSKGGAEKVLLEVLRRSTYDITLFTLYHDPENTFDAFDDHDVTVIGSNRSPGGFVDRVVRFGFGSLFTSLPLDGYDALVVSEAGLGSLITLRNSDRPVHCYCHTPLRAALPSFHGTYRTELHPLLRPLFDIGTLVYNWLERHAWNRFDRVMANSDLTRQRIKSKGLFDGSIRVVHPGVDTGRFDDADDDSGNQDIQPYFLYPSRFRRYKRQDLAITAFAEADIGGFDLVLAGASQEEEYIQELEELAGDRVHIRTDVSEEEWRTLYRNAYAMLFLAENEDWGIAPLEAMAAGKPVIAVDEGGYTDVVESGETGILVDATPASVGAAMAELAGDEERAQAMGDAGRDAVDTYSWENFIHAFDDEVVP